MGTDESRLTAEVDRTSGQLLTAALAGHEDSWDQLVSRHIRLVWSIARTFRLDRTAAEDLVQAVWLRLLEHGAAMRDPEAVTAWLATTTRRECIAVLGRQRTTLGEDALPEIIDDRRPDDACVQSERDRLLWRALQRLPQRDAMLLRLLAEGLRYGEVAAALGMPRGSVGPTRARALAKLRAELDEAGLHALADVF